MRSELIEVAGGRRLEVFDSSTGGVPAVWHHGTPSCGMVYEKWAEICAARGLRLVGYSRPGYGRSDRHEGRSIGDCAADVAAVADSLGAERFYVIGHSGGGAHALACPALLGERVLATAVVACAAPHDAEELNWLEGQGQENVEEFEAALTGGETLRRLLEGWAAEMLAEVEDDPDPGEAHEPLSSLGSLVSDADRASITPEALEFGAARRKHSLAPGIWGWYDDDIAETTPWGFDVHSISRPVAVWHGRQDRFVPFAHGEWLVANIPDARPHLLEDEGHFSMLETRFDELIDDLVALAAD